MEYDIRYEPFLNYKKYPEIFFESSKIVNIGNEEFLADGNLTIHGIKRKAQIDFKVVAIESREGEESLFLKGGELSIDLRDYGIPEEDIFIVGWSIYTLTYNITSATLKMRFFIEALKRENHILSQDFEGGYSVNSGINW